MAQRSVNLELPLGGISDGSIPGSKVSYACDVVPERGMLKERLPRGSASTYKERTVTTYDLRNVGFLKDWSYIYYDSSDPNQSGGLYANDGSYTQVWYPISYSSYFDTEPNLGVGPAPDGRSGWISVGDELIMADGGSSSGPSNGTRLGFIRWAGGRTGTATLSSRVSTTAGSKSVTGTASTFTSGMENNYITIQSSTTDVYQCRRIVKYVSDTKIIVDAPMDETLTNRSATVNQLGVLTGSFKNATITDGRGLFNVCRSSGVNYTTNLGPASAQMKALMPNGATAAFHKGRLFVGNIVESQYDTGTASEIWMPNRIRWSGLPSVDSAQNIGEGISHWDYNAWVDADDMGGITGLASFAGDLIVICKNGVQILRGDVNTDGSYTGATLSVIDRNGGAADAGSWCVGSDGVYWANADGLFVWDGAKIVDLSSPIKSTWKSSIGEAITDVGDMGDRISVQYLCSNKNGSQTWHCLTYFKNVSGWFDSTGGDTYDGGTLGSIGLTKPFLCDGVYYSMGMLTTTKVGLIRWDGGSVNDYNGNVISPVVATQTEWIGAPYRIKEVGIDFATWVSAQVVRLTAKAFAGNRGSMTVTDPLGCMLVASGTADIGSGSGAQSGPQFNRISMSNAVAGGTGRKGTARSLSVEISVTDTNASPSTPSIRILGDVVAVLDVDELMENA